MPAGASAAARPVAAFSSSAADVTINSVFDAAKASGGSPHLSNPMKLAFAKQVTRQYFAELADEERVIEIDDPPKRARSDRPAVVVEVPNSPPAPHEGADKKPVFVVESTAPSHAAPDDSPGPITSPSQLEHEPAPPPGVVLAPIEHPDAAGAPPIAAPVVPPPPIAASAGDGPTRAGQRADRSVRRGPEHYGYPEDPYAYNYAQGAAPHA
jgi:hypothetical protein